MTCCHYHTLFYCWYINVLSHINCQIHILWIKRKGRLNQTKSLSLWPFTWQIRSAGLNLWDLVPVCFQQVLEHVQPVTAMDSEGSHPEVKTGFWNQHSMLSRMFITFHFTGNLKYFCNNEFAILYQYALLKKLSQPSNYSVKP